MIFKQQTVKSWFTGIKTSINNEVIQPFQNAEQIILKYNQAIQHNSLTRNGWERLLTQSDDGLKAYLTTIKGTTASMTDYTVSLQGNITGFKKVSSAITQYNALATAGTQKQNEFSIAVATTNGRLGGYLRGLGGAKASLGGYANSLVSATAKTIVLQVATTALNAAVSMGITAAISLAVKGFDKLINSAKRASDAANEAFSESNSKVQENKEETKTLDELIQKYKELRRNENLDTDERKQVKNLQNDIADLAGAEAQNLDLVNGKLDEEIKKLDEISEKQAKRAYENATANYNNAVRANENATGSASIAFVDGYAYVGDREKEAEKILQDAGFVNYYMRGGRKQAGGRGVGNNGFSTIVFDTYDRDGNLLKGAQKKADYLQSMIDVLEQNGQKESQLSAGLVEQRDKYLDYITNQKNAANSLVSAWITYSQSSNNELSGINVDSAESFEEYRQKMIEVAKSDDSIGQILADGTLSEESLEIAINDFMSTATQFSEWYKQWADNVIGDTFNDKNPISFSNTISQIQSLSKGLDQLGKIYADVYDKGDFDWSSILNNEDFSETFSRFTNEYDAFIKTISGSPDDIKACQSAFDDLATAYIHSTDALKNLTPETKNTATAMLEQMGVANAEEIVTGLLAYRTEVLSGKKQFLKETAKDLETATAEEVAQFIWEEGVVQGTAQAVAAYSLEKQLANSISLCTSGDIANMIALAEACGSAASALKILYAVKSGNLYGGGNGPGVSEEDYRKILADAEKEIESSVSNIKTGGTKPVYTGGSATKSATGKAGRSGSGSAKKETFNWIERLLKAISEKTKKAAESFTKAFSLTSAQEKYAQYLSQIENELSANNQAITIYQQKLDSVGLSLEWIEKIQNGAFSIEDVTDETLRDQISEYQKWYETLESCYDNVRALEEERLKAQKEYADKVLKSHDDEIRSFERTADRQKALADLKELLGGRASEKDVREQLDSTAARINRMEEQNRYLQELIRTTEYGSDAWKTYRDRIEENRDSIRDLTGTLAELAQELMNLPLERYEAFLDKSSKKTGYFDARMANAGKSAWKETLLDKQAKNIAQTNSKAQETAVKTAGNLRSAGNAFRSAADTDKLYADSTQKPEVDVLYARIEKYVKSGKQIPASLITQLSDKGHSNLAQAAVNYNAALAADQTAQETAKLMAHTTQTELAELAKQKAALPSDRYDRYREKNDAKNELYSAKLSNATGAESQNRIIDKQIGLVTGNNAKAQETAQATAENLRNAVNSIGSAKKTDAKGKTKKQKSVLDSLYKKVQGYVKAGKGIPSTLIAEIAEGNYTTLYQAAVNYNEMRLADDAAQQVAALSAETSEKELAQLAQAKFNNIRTEYERKQGVISHQADLTSSELDLATEKGYLTGQGWYDSLIRFEEQKNSSLSEKLARMRENLDAAVASGEIEMFSDEWWEAADAIHATEEEIAQSDLTLQKYRNDQRQAGFDHFDYLQEQISRLTSEADFYISSMKNMQLKDDGRLSSHGITAAGLHYQNYDTYRKQADDYAGEISRIQSMLAENPHDTKLLEQLQKYQDAQRQCILNSEDEKRAVADLVREGYESLISSLGKAISKYKELIQNAKNAHDYQNRISEQTETIASLRKQLAAYSRMSGNEETAARIQTLDRELADALKNMQETLYDKYISDTQDALDDMLSELEEFVNELYNNIDALFRDGVTQVKGSVETVNSTLAELSGSYGTTLSEAIGAAWADGYYNPSGALASIQAKMDALIAASEAQAAQAAADSADDRNAGNVTISSTPDGTQEETARPGGNISSLPAPEKKPVILSDSADGRQKILSDSTEDSLKRKALSFIKKNVQNPSKKYDSYSDVNRVIWNNAAGIYSGKGKVLSEDNLHKLAKELGITYNNAGSGGSLYKKLKNLGISGFARGSAHIPRSQLALTQEEGTELIHRTDSGAMLTPLRQGDMVFTNDMTRRLWELSQAEPDRLFKMTGNIAGLKVIQPAFTARASAPERNLQAGNGDTFVTIDELNLPNVKNYSDFRNELIKDSGFEKAVQSMTTGRLSRKGAGTGDMAKYRYLKP